VHLVNFSKHCIWKRKEWLNLQNSPVKKERITYRNNWRIVPHSKWRSSEWPWGHGVSQEGREWQSSGNRRACHVRVSRREWHATFLPANYLHARTSTHTTNKNANFIPSHNNHRLHMLHQLSPSLKISIYTFSLEIYDHQIGFELHRQSLLNEWSTNVE